MSTDAEQVRERIDVLLGELPDISVQDSAHRDSVHDSAHHDPDRRDLDIDDVARRLEEAHDILVQALESVEKG